GRAVPLYRDCLAGCDAAKLVALDSDLECSENHAPRRHLENDRVQPIDEQKLCIWCIALDLHGFLEFDLGRVGHHGRHCQRRLLERGCKGWPSAADTNVRVMRKMACS